MPWGLWQTRKHRARCAPSTPPSLARANPIDRPQSLENINSLMPLSHPILLASTLLALALAAIVPACGQQPAPPAQRRADPTQLDRIEHKLDEILQRLDQFQ